TPRIFFVVTEGLRSCSPTTMPVRRCWRKGTRTRPPIMGAASAGTRYVNTMSSGTGRATSQNSGIDGRINYQLGPESAQRVLRTRDGRGVVSTRLVLGGSGLDTS